MPKPLNIGMIGYGFMGKAHSNAYRRVGDFFPELEHRPGSESRLCKNEVTLRPLRSRRTGGMRR